MDNSIDNDNQISVSGAFASELELFEEFARQAIGLGFTVILTDYRFHPAHTRQYPDVCQSGIRLTIVPILEEAKFRFGSNQDLNGLSIYAVVVEGLLLLSRYEAGQILVKKPDRKKRFNISPKERERRAEQMRAYWRKKRGQAAELGKASEASDGD